MSDVPDPERLSAFLGAVLEWAEEHVTVKGEALFVDGKEFCDDFCVHNFGVFSFGDMPGLSV